MGMNETRPGQSESPEISTGKTEPLALTYALALMSDRLTVEAPANAAVIREHIRSLRDLFASHADLVAALKEMVEWSDCGCDDHTAPDCCAALPSNQFHCPGCIAGRALAKALR